MDDRDCISGCEAVLVRTTPSEKKDMGLVMTLEVSRESIRAGIPEHGSKW